MLVNMPENKREFYVSCGGTNPQGCLGGGSNGTGSVLKNLANNSDAVTADATDPDTTIISNAQKSLSKSLISRILSSFFGVQPPEESMRGFES